MFNANKYPVLPALQLPERRWPNRTLTQAPDWCSVDLRDGNQALVNPMNIKQKTRMFKLLVKLGFKEIEVGFPSASQTDFDFVRALIEQDLIPDDVRIQALTQAREPLIARTYESLAGAKQAIVHVYNSTSTVQREQVFGLDREGIKAIAVEGARHVRNYAQQYPDTEWEFQYSPESFTGTEVEYAVEVCDAVIAEWQPEQGRKVIINLPATVEMTTPNVFADQIEWFCDHLAQRDQVRISLHTHNDRGCGVAAAELGTLAGADRIEGTLLGNGERTGNMDIVTMAMNLYSRGIDPQLDLSDAQEIIDVVEYCTELQVHPRHPWVGELVYTAFSGSHQDAIRKSMHYHEEHALKQWEVAYLPIDPRDLGREYEAVIRVNSQSGKGGVALILERDYDISLPKWMHTHLSRVVQLQAETSGAEVSPEAIHELYQQRFVKADTDWQLKSYDLHTEDEIIQAGFTLQAVEQSTFKGQGPGILMAVCDALQQRYGIKVRITQFDESALSTGSSALAQTCIELEVGDAVYAGVGVSQDVSRSVIQALLTAFSRSRS